MNEYLEIATTTSDRDQAQQIAESLVAKRLAACVQIEGPICSVYRWQDKIEQADEWRCRAKTCSSLRASAEQTIRELHTYECPEIVARPLGEILPDYRDWLATQLKDLS